MFTTSSVLPPGSYTLEAEKAGFKKQTLQDVIVAGERTQGINITLEVGDVTQTVTVSGDVLPNLDTQSGNISGTLTSNDVQNLPALGRDPFQLLRLAPGVFGDGAHAASGGSQNTPGSQGPGGTSATSSIFQTENQVQVNANGQRNTANSFQVDGVSVNSLDWGGAATITPERRVDSGSSRNRKLLRRAVWTHQRRTSRTRFKKRHQPISRKPLP